MSYQAGDDAQNHFFTLVPLRPFWAWGRAINIGAEEMKRAALAMIEESARLGPVGQGRALRYEHLNGLAMRLDAHNDLLPGIDRMLIMGSGVVEQFASHEELVSYQESLQKESQQRRDEFVGNRIRRLEALSRPAPVVAAVAAEQLRKAWPMPPASSGEEYVDPYLFESGFFENRAEYDELSNSRPIVAREQA